MQNNVLFTDGEWRICRTGLKYSNSIIEHQCGNGEFQMWWHISTKDHCVYCQDKVPEPILGLWTLHNWDR